MDIELKPREWLLALWADGTFTVEGADAPCWQAFAPPEAIRVVAAMPIEAALGASREVRNRAIAGERAADIHVQKLESALADERKHADALAGLLQSLADNGYEFNARGNMDKVDDALTIHRNRRRGAAE